MRVLIAHKFWYRRGGAEQVVLDEDRALREHGHETAHFSTSHPDNDPSPWQDYFAPYLELGGDTLSVADKATAAARLFRNRVAAKSFSRLLDDCRPDVVHAHGIHRQLSPSILLAAHRRGVPVVQTLHDAHKVCPADLLLRSGSKPCWPPRCGAAWYGPAIANRCLRGSAGITTLALAELAFQRASGVYSRCVTRFVTPSCFLAEALRRGGWGRVPISVVPNAVEPSGPGRTGDGFVFIGRLVPGKGVLELAEAAARAGVRVTFAGEGPLKAKVERHTQARAVGWLDGDDLRALLGEARAAVVPSTCLEIAPLAVLEAMAAGVAVIASDVGGIPELVRDGREGLLVRPGEVDGLAAALSRLAADRVLAERLGRAGRARVIREFTMSVHVRRLMEVFEAAIGRPGVGVAS